MDNPCTCGHGAERHNSLGVCVAFDAVELCPCTDFTSDDTALADAVGVLAETRANDA